MVGKEYHCSNKECRHSMNKHRLFRVGESYRGATISVGFHLRRQTYERHGPATRVCVVPGCKCEGAYPTIEGAEPAQ